MTKTTGRRDMLEEMSSTEVQVTRDDDGRLSVMDPSSGRALGDDVGRWDRKQWLQFSKQHGVEHVNLKGLGRGGSDNRVSMRRLMDNPHLLSGAAPKAQRVNTSMGQEFEPDQIDANPGQGSQLEPGHIDPMRRKHAVGETKLWLTRRELQETIRRLARSVLG